jgi:hypothetical protein
MTRWLRIALVWLSLLAVSLQGMAGAAVAACGTSGAGMESTFLASAVLLPAPDDSPMAEHPSPPCSLSDTSEMSCQGAAACQAPVALVSSDSVAAGAVAAGAPATSVPAQELRFGTGAPDRPPRSFIA